MPHIERAASVEKRVSEPTMLQGGVEVPERPRITLRDGVGEADDPSRPRIMLRDDLETVEHPKIMLRNGPELEVRAQELPAESLETPPSPMVMLRDVVELQE
jgi:hypothetical protein